MRKKMLMLTAAMMLVLSACGSGSKDEGSKGTDSASQSTTDQAANTEAAGDDAADDGADAAADDAAYKTPDMDFDLGGRTIKVVSWWDMTPGEDNPDNIQKKKNLEELEKKHNFKMEFVAIDFGEYQQKVTASLLSGQPLGDIVRLGKTYTVPTLTKQDLLLPIDEYTKNTNVFNQKMTNELYTYNGRGYGFTEDQGALIQGIFYNRKLMNELGMKPLQDYVTEGNWNWDTFVQAAKEANKDTNNDGKLDTWGLANNSLLDQALMSNEASLTKEDKQNLDDPKTIEALTFAQKVIVDKVNRPTEGGDWTEPGQFFRQGNTLMYAGAMYEIGGLKTDMPDADIGFVPFPKGPSASTFHSYEPALQALTIPKGVKDPDKLMYIWEKMNDIDSMYDYPSQASLETNFSNEDDIENAKLVQANLSVLDHNTFMPDLKYYDFAGELNGGTSVSTVIEKYKSVFQSAIDKIYKK
ncbi:extracellular solute-binding protein [Paenibacillus cellulosilyticus]|uniref:Extracellular solute-binding protein n=1 Tax=Paenibacillus cellulosilyticus TaxID=375489 RepID=A0A2V2Z774_9BACL|nr:extracellular solute-binding protein [Paenibacillus cellulosilyticus]PWW07216.1 extracellular solute-binding protein [Paenibacillus cellulosilyticus]QKS44587.1 extracellular solute-binding protein [Paenibacillus cellulosilyticus]